MPVPDTLRLTPIRAPATIKRNNITPDSVAFCNHAAYIIEGRDCTARLPSYREGQTNDSNIMGFTRSGDTGVAYGVSI
jgi:hypothetical protein